MIDFEKVKRQREEIFVVTYNGFPEAASFSEEKAIQKKNELVDMAMKNPAMEEGKKEESTPWSVNLFLKDGTHYADILVNSTPIIERQIKEDEGGNQ